MTLSHRITDKRDDLIRLTQDLIRIPTLNPPGENYREICDFLDKRLSQHGFQTQLILEHRRAARRGADGRMRAFQQPHRCGRGGTGLDL